MNDTKPLIRLGDLFRAKDGFAWKVIGLKPGGRVEMFCSERVWFTDRWHRDVLKMERLVGKDS